MKSKAPPTIKYSYSSYGKTERKAVANPPIDYEWTGPLLAHKANDTVVIVGQILHYPYNTEAVYRNFGNAYVWQLYLADFEPDADGPSMACDEIVIGGDDGKIALAMLKRGMIIAAYCERRAFLYRDIRTSQAAQVVNYAKRIDILAEHGDNPVEEALGKLSVLDRIGL